MTPAPMLPMRLVDHAADAKVEGDLVAALAALHHPLVAPSPLPTGDAFPRALQVAFAEPELTRLLPTSTHDPARPRAASAGGKIDLTWNRTRGIYEAREALFVPAGARYEYTLPAGPAARLTADLGAPPGDARGRLIITLDGAVLAELAPGEGRWEPHGIPLPARVGTARLGLTARGGIVFVGAPVVRLAHPPLDERPNVIFIVVDTLRADALGAMPRLSVFAAQGARFSQAITAATWTRPSLVAALGGDLATRLGHSAEDMIPSERERRRFRALRPALLPRRLAEAGWDTRAIGNNFFLLGFPRIGLDLGLDAVTDVRHPVLDTPAITAEAIRFLAAPREAPFFLYLHYDAPHWPYTAPPSWQAAARGRHLNGLDADPDPMIGAYLGEAAYADAALGELFAALDRDGLAERTIVVVIGDHGEVFDPAHAHVVDALGQPTLHHHGWSAYDEIGRVPLVIRWPGRVTPRVIDAQTSLVDLAPTIAALAGLPAIAEPRPVEPTRGRSLADALRGPPGIWPEPTRPAFIEGQDVRALRADGWLYLVRSDGHLHRGDRRIERREELYELASDPLQHRDRSDDPSAPLERMRSRFAQSAPALPPFAEPIVHLALAEDARPHVLRGEIRCPGGTLAVHAIERGRAEPSPRGLRVELDGGGRLDLVLDPPDAALDLQLRRDDLAVDANRLLLGPLALPLLGGRFRQETGDVVSISSERLGWLDAPHAPFFDERGDVLLWRDPGALAGTGATRTAAADSEVSTMMQRWGYAQPSAHPR
jgi:arylsulfatase A-like enzyme